MRKWMAYLFSFVMFFLSTNVGETYATTLHWSPVAENSILGYRAYRRVEGEVFDINSKGIMINAETYWEGTQTSTPLEFFDSGTYYFSVSAFNIKGEGPVSEEVSYTYSKPSAPIATAGMNQSVDEGDMVYLDASGSTASVELNFSWLKLRGPSIVLLNSKNEKANFVAPNVDKNELMIFRVLVSDGINPAVPATTFVTIKNIVEEEPNEAPTAFAGTLQTVPKIATVHLNGSGTDDKAVISYHWTKSLGPAIELINADSATPSFDSLPGTYIFLLTVKDAEGLTSAPSRVVIRAIL